MSEKYEHQLVGIHFKYFCNFFGFSTPIAFRMLRLSISFTFCFGTLRKIFELWVVVGGGSFFNAFCYSFSLSNFLLMFELYEWLCLLIDL